MKKVIIKEKNGVYKIPIILKKFSINKKYFFEYNDGLYDKEIKQGDKNVRQVSMLVNALNIINLLGCLTPLNKKPRAMHVGV